MLHSTLLTRLSAATDQRNGTSLTKLPIDFLIERSLLEKSKPIPGCLMLNQVLNKAEKIMSRSQRKDGGVGLFNVFFSSFLDASLPHNCSLKVATSNGLKHISTLPFSIDIGSKSSSKTFVFHTFFTSNVVSIVPLLVPPRLS